MNEEKANGYFGTVYCMKATRAIRECDFEMGAQDILAKYVDYAIAQERIESQKREAELRSKFEEQASIFNAVLNPRGNNLDGFAAKLSAAKQEGYEQGYAKGSAVAVEAEMIAEQRGRDEVLRGLSEQEPVAFVSEQYTLEGHKRMEAMLPDTITEGTPLIIRPSAQIAAAKGDKHE